MAKRAGLLRRTARFALWTLLGLAAVALSVVLALRWLNPPTSAFMLGSRLGALFAGEHDYSTHYQWADLEHISPQAALAVIAAEDLSLIHI